MKKIIIAFSFLAIAPTICSEKNWLQQKVDTFAKKLVTRHTYKNNSLEHCRDRALLLCVLPAKVSQMVLQQQRLNMVKFLEENEINALEGIKKDFSINDQEWSKIMNTIDTEVAFNRQSMRQKRWYYGTSHDPSLPDAWVTALNRECARYGILPENLNFVTTTNPNHFAAAQNYRSRLLLGISFLSTYYPGNVMLNLKSAQQSPQKLNRSAAHEIVHIIKNHGNYCQIIIDEIYKSKNSKYTNHQAYKILIAAQEKTADTLVACTDAEYAHDYTDLVHKGLLNGVYPDNHNDVQVVHANWQLSEIITSSQQLKSLITQKLRVSPKFVV